MIELNGRLAVEQIPGDREYQEDDYGVIDGRALGFDGTEHTVLVLADGMGGHTGGKVASAIVIREFIESYQRKDGLVTDRLRESLDDANAGIAAAIQGDSTLDGMGSTLVAAVVTSKGLEWVSVGDSPLWLYRQGQLRRLNADHSMAPVLNDMVQTGLISPEDAQNDSKRHGLRSAVCGDRMKFIDVSSQPVALQVTDRVLIASDGILTLAEDEISACFHDANENSAPAEVVSKLLLAVQNAGLPGQDNTTIMVLKPERDTSVRASVPPVEVSVGEGQFKVERQSGVSRLTVAGLILAGVVAIAAVVLVVRLDRAQDRSSNAGEPDKTTTIILPSAGANGTPGGIAPAVQPGTVSVPARPAGASDNASGSPSSTLQLPLPATSVPSSTNDIKSSGGDAPKVITPPNSAAPAVKTIEPAGAKLSGAIISPTSPSSLSQTYDPATSAHRAQPAPPGKEQVQLRDQKAK